VDPGFGSDLPATEKLSREAGVPPENMRSIVNPHYQKRGGVPLPAPLPLVQRLCPPRLRGEPADFVEPLLAQMLHSGAA
jgi:hypothetical protein